MKKIGLLMISMFLLIMICGCDAKIADNNVDYSGQTLKGQIDAIDKTTVDLTLGKLKENDGFMQGGADGNAMPMDPGEMPEGERPELPEGVDPFNGEERPEMPEGMEPFGNGEKPELPEGIEPFNGEERPEGMEPFGNGERPELPEGVDPFNDEERPEMPEASFPGQMGPGDMTPSYTFTPGSKTARIDLKGASVILADGSQGSLDDLKEGDIVEITVGENNQVETVTVYEATVNS